MPCAGTDTSELVGQHSMMGEVADEKLTCSGGGRLRHASTQKPGYRVALLRVARATAGWRSRYRPSD